MENMRREYPVGAAGGHGIEIPSTRFTKLENGVSILVRSGENISFQLDNTDYYSLWTIIKGEFTFDDQTRNRQLVLCQNDSLFSCPGGKKLLSSADGFSGSVLVILIRDHAFLTDFLPGLHLSDTMFRMLVQSSTENRGTVNEPVSFLKDAETQRRLTEILLTAAASVENQETVLSQSVQELLCRYFKKFAEQYVPDRGDSGPVQDYILSHLDTATLYQAAKHFRCHPNTISYRLRENYGKTFSRILSEKRMYRAALLLRYTSLSNEEIAHITGITDASSFYRVFKRMYGMTPGDFRREKCNTLT